MDNSFSGAAFGILLVAVIAFSDALGDLTDETISYQANCSQDVNHRSCYVLTRTTYRVRPTSGEVVYWMKDSGLNPPHRLANCSIWDSENWQCEYQDGSGPVVMVEGLKAKIKSDNPATVSLRWWQWHALRLSKLMGSILSDWPDFLTADQRYCEFMGARPIRFTTCEPRP